ncbi:hypothetical protein [Streptomyces decoyicus]|uniref:hypothetical protein n=1 Tax=Streptomyces decoyicus TaxID=249567 RepID=UPI00386A58C0|nr:hypothetical protein OG532_16785 [Streptomyces decoyicus]
MQKLVSEKFAYWACRRLYGWITPYDRCFSCGNMHIPPSDKHPHNGRYDFTGADTAVEVVSIVNSDALRNSSSWNKHHPGQLEGEPQEFGLSLPWVIEIPGSTPISQLEVVLETVRSMEQAGIRSTDTYGCAGKRCTTSHGREICVFCTVAYSPGFNAHVDDEGLVTSRPGLATILVNVGSSATRDETREKIAKLIYPTGERRSDVLQKLDLAQRHGKRRRIACFVLDQFFSLPFGPDPSLLTRDTVLPFPWDAVRPVTDAVVAAPDWRWAVAFSLTSAKSKPRVWDGTIEALPSTLGCSKPRPVP